MFRLEQLKNQNKETILFKIQPFGLEKDGIKRNRCFNQNGKIAKLAKTYLQLEQK